IKMRFGLEDGSEHTLEEVGQNFAVTRERIRQIEAKALRKLRHPSQAIGCAHFWRMARGACKVWPFHPASLTVAIRPPAWRPFQLPTGLAPSAATAAGTTSATGTTARASATAAAEAATASATTKSATIRLR